MSQLVGSLVVSIQTHSLPPGADDPLWTSWSVVTELPPLDAADGVVKRERNSARRSLATCRLVCLVPLRRIATRYSGTMQTEM